MDDKSFSDSGVVCCSKISPKLICKKKTKPSNQGNPSMYLSLANPEPQRTQCHSKQAPLQFTNITACAFDLSGVEVHSLPDADSVPFHCEKFLSPFSEPPVCLLYVYPA